jgi:hypothetical protein
MPEEGLIRYSSSSSFIFQAPAFIIHRSTMAEIITLTFAIPTSSTSNTAHGDDAVPAALPCLGGLHRHSNESAEIDPHPNQVPPSMVDFLVLPRFHKRNAIVCNASRFTVAKCSHGIRAALGWGISLHSQYQRQHYESSCIDC